MGGTDDPTNLIELTIEEHSQAHLKLYQQYGKTEDLCAYYMLSGKNKDPEFVKSRAKLGGESTLQKRMETGLTGIELFYGRSVSNEELKENSIKGGLIQGSRNSESGHMREIQKLSDCSAAGKIGGAKTIAGGRGSFADPIERLKSASKGGKVQGKRNAESGHLKEICKKSKRNSGMFWITNGTDSRMIKHGDVIEDGWRKGRVQKTKI